MSASTLRVALVTEVFHDDPDGRRLTELLRAAAEEGADIAVLPELPLNPWSPASKEARDEDAEPPGGVRAQLQAQAAGAAKVALLGGAIIRDPASGERFNTALLFTPDGRLAAHYRKIHLPEEEGYWETSHYVPGASPPEVVRGVLPWPVGVQICSDVNRPEGFQLLAAGGADLVLAPRATPPETYARWRLILGAEAIMSATYVISVNRPRPELGASIGGPSVAIDPFGEVLLETTEPLALVTLERTRLEEARRAYPGYLARFPRVYREGWDRLAGE